MLAIALAALLNVQSGNQFDLICEGEHIGQWTTDEKREVFNTRYRIDLDRSVWCGADCTSMQGIASVTPTRIVLRPTGPAVLGGRDEGLSIDRSTGQLSGGTTASFMRTRVTAQCRWAPFSGMPERKF